MTVAVSSLHCNILIKNFLPNNNRRDYLGTETNVYSHVFCISTDIDECAEGSDECEHMCMNTEGNYTCSCFETYLLADDGKSCTSK